MAGNLDKQSRLTREKAARAAEQHRRVRSLDPKFPFKVIAFDAEFFKVPREVKR